LLSRISFFERKDLKKIAGVKKKKGVLISTKFKALQKKTEN